VLTHLSIAIAGLQGLRGPLFRDFLSSSVGEIPSIFPGWWCNTHLERYEFVNGILPYYLVGGIPTNPAENDEFVSWDDDYSHI